MSLETQRWPSSVCR